MKFKQFKKKALHEYGDLFAIFTIDFLTVRLAYLIQKYTKISPNQITLTRIFFLAPLTILLLLLAPYLELSILYLFVAILMYFIMFTDNLDGQLARGTGNTSKSGAFLDSIADRISNIILFVFIFSVALWTDNTILLYSSILLFALKTINLMLITKVFYYEVDAGKDKDSLFGYNILYKDMGFQRIWDLGKKINKFLKIKRWVGGISSFEQYFVVIIIPSILIFFNLEIYVVYFMYFVIIFFVIFYLKRIKAIIFKYV